MGWTPDVVIFVRPDVRIGSDLPVGTMLQMRRNDVLVPHHMGFGGFNDRIGVCCAGAAADAYGERVDGVASYLDSLTRKEITRAPELHPETYLKHTLEVAHRLRVRTIGIKLNLVDATGYVKRFT